MEIDKIYQELTGINIKGRMILKTERNKGYYGEYLIFKELFLGLDNIEKILMNVQIPTVNFKTTEIDLILIMETGIYVFESKYYKGTIYGSINDDNWTQWFITKESSHFQNPIKQNQYHIDNLKRLFPEVPIYSYIVFTNYEDCLLKVDNVNTENITVCELPSLLYNLNNDIKSRTKVLSMEDIENIFRTLIPYAPIMATELQFGEEKINLNDYIHEIVAECKGTKNRLEQDYNKKCTELKNQAVKYKQSLEQKQKKIKRKTVIIGIVITFLISFVMSFLSSMVTVALHMDKQKELRILEDQLTAQQEILNNEKQELEVKEEKYNELIQKFESVENIKINDQDLIENLGYSEDLVLENSKSINDTVDFSCTLYSVNDKVNIIVKKDTTITVVLKNGNIKEYKVFNEQYPYSADVSIPKKNKYYKGKSIATHHFVGIKKEEISLIKLTKLGVRDLTGTKYGGELMTENYEMILYKK